MEKHTEEFLKVCKEKGIDAFMGIDTDVFLDIHDPSGDWIFIDDLIETCEVDELDADEIMYECRIEPMIKIFDCEYLKMYDDEGEVYKVTDQGYFKFSSVIKPNGESRIFSAAKLLMDTDIREEISKKFAPCSTQTFYDEYCKVHKERFEEDFEV